MENIKVYSDLNKEQKQRVYAFIRLETNLASSYEQMEEIFNGKIHDYGKGVIFYFIEDEVVASLCIVLEVVEKLHKSYIHKVGINKEMPNIHKILGKLIQEAILISKTYGAEDIRMGLSDENIIQEAEKIGLKKEYKSLEMKLNESTKQNEILQLKELNIINKEDYVEIYNDSFSDMPHGTLTDIETVTNLLAKPKDENKQEYYFMVCDNNEEIGFMEVTIENDKGMFDIGLCKKYRNKGYGKRLLETAIQFLVNKKVRAISLIVIEQNQVAYNMYKKRGFEVSHVIGEWITL